MSDAIKDGLYPYTPLGGLEKELYANAKEAGIWEFLPILSGITRCLQIPLF